MAGENKVEYERVDEKGDKYKRVLVKFNPKFLRGSDFEIEFIPFEEAIAYGKIFVTEIDSMSSIDLYRWVYRETCLSEGVKNIGAGSIISKKDNNMMAANLFIDYRDRVNVIEPRQIIARVKRMFEDIRKEYSITTAYIFNHFLAFSELGSYPVYNKNFSIEKLKIAIEKFPYPGKNSSGEVVERPLVDHLFDIHKTKYVIVDILNFLEHTRIEIKKTMESILKEQH